MPVFMPLPQISHTAIGDPPPFDNATLDVADKHLLVFYQNHYALARSI
jgi:hypothetical protein